MRLVAFTVICFLSFGCTPAVPPTMPTPIPARSEGAPPASDKLLAQSQSVSDLSRHANDATGSVIPPWLQQRPALLEERQRLREVGDQAGLARVNSVLASEAFSRAARLTARWLDRRDSATGLFPTALNASGRFWRYSDTASDLFPFLALATRLLLTERYPEILQTLAAERALSPGLPRDISLDSGGPVEKLNHDKQMLGAIEYGKDGLLPLVELLGPDPWLGRLREVMDQAIDKSREKTPYGPIPADSTEVNGSALQALSRLYWVTRDPQYLAMGNRITSAYLDDALPQSGYLPSYRWDFAARAPIGPGRFFLVDHGNEIVSGLVEWHRVEMLQGAPTVGQHRATIRRMLERLLEKGRSSSGLWYQQIDVPNGNKPDRGQNDNWGYLAQAYLNQAQIERTASGGDPELGRRFEEAAASMLRAVSNVHYFAWEDGQMDGYADTLEGAIYLLAYFELPEAADWVDEQIAVLYGYQREDGRVRDENIDGNFVRTALLYGFSLTQGVRLDPWSEAVALGAARDGECLEIHLHADRAWNGRLVFDSERHRTNFMLPADYPRLNQWPVWFPAQADRLYAVTNEAGQRSEHRGQALAAGIPLHITPGREYRFRVCPV